VLPVEEELVLKEFGEEEVPDVVREVFCPATSQFSL